MSPQFSASSDLAFLTNLNHRMQNCKCSPGIHGWGIFARKALPQDTAVFEYKGDTVGLIDFGI